VLINNHPWARLDDYGLRVGRKLLLGSRFNTVRQEFFSPPLMRNGLLITFGGEDPANHTTWLIEALASEIGRMPTVVVIGPAHPNTEAVQSACELLLPEAEIHLAPATLVPFAHLCHIAVSAAGTTCYELAASGIAMAVLAVEEHQSRIAEEMVSAGAALSLGRFGEIDKEMARRTYADLACPAIAEDLAAAGRTLFPAPGADAIADVLIDFLS
jgi:UDP-2,4-diacetamido-2,4,6-trideoxy-beta-L-altropyranose hydrolase